MDHSGTLGERSVFAVTSQTLNFYSKTLHWQIDQVSAEDHAGQSLLKMLYMQHTHISHIQYISTSLSEPAQCCSGQLLRRVWGDFIVPCGRVDQMVWLMKQCPACREPVCQRWWVCITAVWGASQL